MNAEIDNYATDSDAESEYSEYSDDGDNSMSDSDNEQVPDVMGPVTDYDYFDQGTEDLTEEQFQAEATSHLRANFGDLITPELVRNVITLCRGVRFWILDEYNEMEFAHFLEPFDDLEEAYIDAIMHCVDGVFFYLNMPQIYGNYSLKSEITTMFFDNSNVFAPRKEVLWILKELASVPTR